MDIASIWLRFYPLILRYLQSLTHRQAEAEDLAQTVFVRAMEHADHMLSLTEEHVKAWLLRAAYNLFIDDTRKRKRLTPLTDTMQPAYEETFSSLHVEQMLNHLPKGLREIVRLRHIEGYTSKQIGERLDMPPATVRTQLRAAVILLRQYEKTQSGGIP